MSPIRKLALWLVLLLMPERVKMPCSIGVVLMRGRARRAVVRLESTAVLRSDGTVHVAVTYNEVLAKLLEQQRSERDGQQVTDSEDEGAAQDAISGIEEWAAAEDEQA